MPATYGFKRKARDLLSYPWRFTAYWFSHGGWVKAFLGGLAGAFVVAWEYSLYLNCGPSISFAESTARIWGAMLQLFGLGLVAWGIRENTQLFDQPSTVELIKHLWKNSPRVFRRPQYIEAGLLINGSGHIHAAAVGRLTVPATTIEGRIAELERQMEDQLKHTAQNKQAIADEQSARAKAIEAERHARVAEDSRLEKKLSSAIAGGLKLEALGLYWLLVGTVASAVASDLQRLKTPAFITCAGL